MGLQSDSHNKIKHITYSVLVDGVFVKRMFNDSRGVQDHPNVPLSYNGRVKIEGRATLVIKSINPEDNTKFRCEIREALSTELKAQFSLLWQVCIADITIDNQS